jgi:hypothetical protein
MFDPERGSSTFLRNVETLLDYARTASFTVENCVYRGVPGVMVSIVGGHSIGRSEQESIPD